MHHGLDKEMKTAQQIADFFNCTAAVYAGSDPGIYLIDKNVYIPFSSGLVHPVPLQSDTVVYPQGEKK